LKTTPDVDLLHHFPFLRLFVAIKNQRPTAPAILATEGRVASLKQIAS
jgi:hypothetical protein